jgi:hypothetical protein
MKVKIQNFCFALTSLGILSSLGGLALMTMLKSVYTVGLVMGFGIGLTLTGFILRLISNKF